MKMIKITAIWCTSCILMNPIIDEVKEKLNIELISYDYDMDCDQFNKYNIGNILPVLICLDDKGNEVGRVVGEKSRKELLDIVGKMYE